jgi:hypothetical protein
VEKTKQVRELVCYENHPHSGEVSYRYKIWFNLHNPLILRLFQ